MHLQRRAREERHLRDENHEVTAAAPQDLIILEEETERDGDNDDHEDEKEQSSKVNRRVITHILSAVQHDGHHIVYPTCLFNSDATERTKSNKKKKENQATGAKQLDRRYSTIDQYISMKHAIHFAAVCVLEYASTEAC